MTPYGPETWAYGGIPRLTGTLARALARRGHDVTVCSTDAGDASRRLSPRPHTGRFRAWPPRQLGDGVARRVFPNLSNRLAYRHQLFLPIGFDSYMRRHAQEFDVAHLHACRNSPGAIAAHYLDRAGVPYVLAPNGTAPRLERRRLVKRAFDLLVGRHILDGAARVLAVSHAERRQLRALEVPDSRIRTVPNPIDLEEFRQPVPRGAFRRGGGFGAARLVVFLGKLTPRKRVDVLIRAFARIGRPDARLVIGGNDMGSGDALVREVRALGLENVTTFIGLVEGRDRLSLLADADVLVYPSADEIFGLVPLEAILSGTPVIVSDDSGCGEVIGATGGGLVTPLGDVDALSAAIGAVLSAPADWRASVAEAAFRIRARYDADAIASHMDQVYADVCHG